MTKTATKTKKPTKYHYIFFYNRGNYFEISRGLEKRYSRYFYGSGMGVSGFDIQFYCTPKIYKRIVACARRRYGKIKSVTRYTEEALYGDV
ncbi:hypothetical protein EBZ39_08310 [bacterium]|nr:hypothetical protein [bacterium]